ncbi:MULTISPECIES: PASTA domain-containing protein [unclassified Zunongwangia]|uniref:PASTA domain-containing protein n=1 Tax=unclassified Zunongwangia TaxID=2632541 RepID=UPI0022DDDDBA|nr:MULTISPECIES: PASTA domain-containing protein [unclassified Zunongwangia]WBL21726.1 PASTA domain-containing protein [Zunongwangia sp. HRR-M8]WBL26326.1 PASTA domain-containing protein [Zunongwangia sp. HGR-M22]
MGLFKFIFSKTFLIQLVLAIILVVVLVYGAMQWLEYTTNQGERIEVPNLAELSLSEVETLLDENDLRYEILDSANFNPDYPRFSVIEQVPRAGKFVKENRKIYLTLNPSGYRKIVIPDLIRRTKRQAVPTLKSLGFEIGEITYKPDIAEDAVLELRHNGELIESGDELMKTSKIDLVLGDGSGSYRRPTEDSTEIEETTDEDQFDF